MEERGLGLIGAQAPDTEGRYLFYSTAIAQEKVEKAFFEVGRLGEKNCLLFSSWLGGSRQSAKYSNLPSVPSNLQCFQHLLQYFTVTMLQCYNVTMLQCYNVTMLQCFNVLMF